MAVSDQYSAVQAQGMKKKKQLYSPMIQEQAKQGIATQMVMDQKNKAMQDQSQQLQEDQFAFDKERAAAADKQWQQNYQLQQEQMGQQQSANNMNMLMGGLSVANTIFDAFGGWDWLGGAMGRWFGG